MRKLPVFATVGNAIAFAFANFFTVLRLVWLPFTVLLIAFGVMGYLVYGPVMEEVWSADPPDPHAVFRHADDLAFFYAAMIVLQIIALSAVAVSIHKVILFGDRKPGDYFVFAFGRSEFLYAVMVVLSFAGVIAVMGAILTPVVYALADGDFAAFFAKFQNPQQAMRELAESGGLALMMGAYMLGWLLLLYFFLRLALWPPTVVATGRLALGEAWALTRGNVLRIFGMFALMIVVIWLLMIPIGIVFGAIMLPFALRHGHRLEDASGPAAMHEMMREMVLPYLAAFFVVELLLYVFLTGLTVAVLSYAYKALKGVDAKEPLPREG